MHNLRPNREDYENELKRRKIESKRAKAIAFLRGEEAPHRNHSIYVLDPGTEPRFGIRDTVCGRS